MASVGVGVGCRRGSRGGGGCGGVPCFGTKLSNHVGSYAGCCAALANAAEKGGHGNANGCVDVDWQVGGDFREPFNISSGRKIGKCVG